MRPGYEVATKKLNLIIGILFVLTAAFLISGKANIGFVTEGSIGVSDAEGSESIVQSVPATEPSSGTKSSGNKTVEADLLEAISVEEEIVDILLTPLPAALREYQLPSFVKNVGEPKASIIFTDELFSPQSNPLSASKRFSNEYGAVNIMRLSKDGLEKINEMVPNSFVVEFDETIQIGSTSRAAQPGIDFGLEDIANYTLRKITTRQPNPTISRIGVVNFKGELKPTKEIIDKLIAIPGIKRAVPNYLFQTTRAAVASASAATTTTPPSSSLNPAPATPQPYQPNDPYFNLQYMHSKIGTVSAWNQATGNGSIVAVVDTGVDWQHEDLYANMWNNAGEIPNNGIDDEGNGFVDDVYGYDFVDTSSPLCDALEDCLSEDNNPIDYVGHGTHVAGIIAAVMNNQKGVAGVCPDCKIMALRAGYAPGYLEFADIVQAIVYATDNGADVINMSFGGDYDDPLMKAALDYAYAHGVILVASAGNNGSDNLTYPGSYENVIGVTATDDLDQLTYFSTYGYWTDIAAPGLDILSTVPVNGYYLSQWYPPLSNDPKYANFSGTSMSGPVVAGVAGLMRGAFPSANVDSLRSGIISGVQRFGTGIPTIYQFAGSGRAHVPTGLARMGRDSTAKLLMDDSPFSQEVFGNLLATGTATGTSFGGVDFDVVPWYDGSPLSGFSTQLNNTVANGLLTTTPSEQLGESTYIIRATQRDVAGNVTRVYDKPFTVKNVTISSPSPYTTINPVNGPVSFIGSIAGDSLTEYTLEYRTDNSQPFSSTGFTYPNNHVKKINEPIATWTPPANLPESAIAEFRIVSTFPNATLNSPTYPYLLDRTIKQGWPVIREKFGGDILGLNIHFMPWKSADGLRDNRIFISNTATTWWMPDSEIFVYNPQGQIENGWPYALPQSISVGGMDYQIGVNGVSGIPSLADVDGDGKDELLLHASYFLDNYWTFGELHDQSAIFALNEDGTLVNGFPILTHHTPVPGFSGWSAKYIDSPVSVIDLDRDGVSELVVSTIEEIGPTAMNNHIGVAKRNVQGLYDFSSIVASTPSTNLGSGDPLRTRLTFLDVDADNELEIVGITTAHGEFDPSQSGKYSMVGHVFAVNEDGTPVTGWPITLGDIQNYDEFNLLLGISSGKMGGQSVIGITAGKVIWTNYPNMNPTFDFYLLDASGNVLQGWPKNFLITNTTDTQAPIFTDVDNDGIEEVLFTISDQVHAYNLAGMEVGAWDYFSGGISRALMDRTLTSQKQNNQPTILASHYTPYYSMTAGALTGSEVMSTPTNQQSPNWKHNILFIPGEPSISSDTVDSRVGMVTSLFDYWAEPAHAIFQLYQWDNSAGLTNGEWPYFMNDKGRSNTGEKSCVTPADGMFITADTTLCPGTYTLSNGISVWNTGTGSIQLTCEAGTIIKGTNQPGSIGISINNSTPGQGSVSVEGCAIKNYPVGIGLYRWSSVDVSNNTLTNNTNGIAVEMPSLTAISLTGTIHGNTITGATTAIRVVNYPGMTVRSNTISTSTNGIYFDHSNGSTLSQNTLTAATGNTGTGIKSDFTNSVVVTNNNVDKFQLNMDLGTNSNFWTTHTNNFYKKTGAAANVRDIGLSNKWYNTATNRGNYWSDHACTDNQAPFGVCENAYVIDSDSKDVKPLKFTV